MSLSAGSPDQRTVVVLPYRVRRRHPCVLSFFLALYAAITIHYWYVSLPLLGLFVGVHIARSASRRRRTGITRP